MQFNYEFYLNDKPIERVPAEALERMSKRLSENMSVYYTSHPEELEQLEKLHSER